MTRKQFISLLVTLIFSVAAAGTAIVWAQAQGIGIGLGTKRASNGLVTVDLSDFMAAREAALAQNLNAVDSSIYEMTYNIAKYEDGDTTCYILNGNSATPLGFSCVASR